MTNDIEWKMVKLGDVCEINPRRTNSFLPDEFTYIDLESVDSGKLNKGQKILKKNAPSRAQRLFEKYDILYQTVRPYQRNNLFVDFETNDFVASTGYAIIRSIGSRSDSRYIYYAIHMDNFVNVVLDKCTGTSYPAINPNLLQSILIPIPYKNGSPDLETQKQIAQKLGDMDSLIAAKEKLLAKKSNLKVAAMQKLIKDEEGENWKKVKIGDYLRVKTGSKNTEDKIDDGKYPLYVRSPIVERINEYTHDCEAVLTAGDGVGTGKVFHYVNGKFAAHQRVYVISNFTEIDGKYFYYQFSQNFYDEVMKYTAKSSVDSVRRGMITGMEIALPFNSDGSPDLIEQRRIASILSDMDSEISAIEKEITKLQDLKTAMMQKMFCFNKGDE